MKKFLLALLARFSEPSTYAGLSGIAVAAGVAEPSYASYSAAAATISGLVSMAMKESGKAE